MAKKPPREPFGCTVAVVVVLGLGYSLPYLFSFSVYAFPLFLGYLLLFARWRGPPHPEHIDELQIAAALRDLKTTNRLLLDEIAELKDTGSRAGIRYLKVEDRFEMRSRRGQELNHALASARTRLAYVAAQIEMAQHPEHRSDNAWRMSMRAWRRGRTYRLALMAALLGFAVSATILEIHVYQGTGSDLLVWNAFPRFIRRHIELATIFGWALGLATLLGVRRINRMIDEREIGTSDHYVEDYDHSVEGYEDHDESDQEVDDDPYSILNVSPQATIPEIKAAYRLAIVKCHPDTVADRSKSIREAAETEAQRINAAYDAIRKEHGFI